MYAIIEDGSHQFRVSEGDRIQVDRRDGKAGDELVFSKVLFIAGGDGGPTIGTPTIEGARVVAKIVNQFKAKKIIIQKFRRRKNMRRRTDTASPTPSSRSPASASRPEPATPRPRSPESPRPHQIAGFPATVRFFYFHTWYDIWSCDIGQVRCMRVPGLTAGSISWSYSRSRGIFTVATLEPRKSAGGLTSDSRACVRVGLMY